MENAFKCDLCSKDFHSLDKLNVHIERQHEELGDGETKHFKCNVCDFKGGKASHLTDHMRTHTGERPFKCQVNDCGRAFKQGSGLKTHMKYKHSNEFPFKCDVLGCRYITKISWDLTKHKKVHSDERPFTCLHSGCNFKTKRKEKLSRHTANVHCETKIFTCSNCNFKADRARTLARHMIVHDGRTEKTPCTIEGCQYKGNNDRALKRHMLRHKTLLPCPVSGQYVITKEALKDHVRLHNPLGRAFQCPLCFKHYPTLVKLRWHCVVHTKEKPFQCGHCNYAAATQAFVKCHIFALHANVEFPFIIHLLDGRECLRCKVTLPSAEFSTHCDGHVS